jgi:hypothetical protein
METNPTQAATPTPGSSTNCPDLLIQKGNTILLYNSNQPIVDGTNPLPFFNLDEYINYLEIQKSNGKTQCPVLYLQMEYNTQGDEVYRMRPSPFDRQVGLPSIPMSGNTVDASRENPPFNANNYAGFDPQGMDIGKYTNLDKIHDSTRENSISDNPMDPNWAGIQYTNQMIDSGKYADNQVSRPVLFNPKTVFYPQIQNGGPTPIDIL